MSHKLENMETQLQHIARKIEGRFNRYPVLKTFFSAKTLSDGINIVEKKHGKGRKEIEEELEKFSQNTINDLEAMKQLEIKEEIKEHKAEQELLKALQSAEQVLQGEL
jgi:hypothetical protein